MTQIGIRQARQNPAELLQQVAAGADVVITRNGKPVARLVRETAASAQRLPSLASWRESVGGIGTAAAVLLREERRGR